MADDAAERGLTLEDRLSPFGLTVSLQDDGAGLLMESTTGVRCIYSGRAWVPLVFPGVPYNSIYARLASLGCGEVRISGQVFPVTNAGMILDVD